MESSAPSEAIQGFTKREQQFFDDLGQGHSAKEIAEMWKISQKTVSTYMDHIREKLSSGYISPRKLAEIAALARAEKAESVAAIAAIAARPGPEQPVTLESFQLFTKQERQVFSHLGQGHSAKQIAFELNISPKTLYTYNDRIRQKLNSGNISLEKLAAIAARTPIAEYQLVPQLPLKTRRILLTEKLTIKSWYPKKKEREYTPPRPLMSASTLNRLCLFYFNLPAWQRDAFEYLSVGCRITEIGKKIGKNESTGARYGKILQDEMGIANSRQLICVAAQVVQHAQSIASDKKDQSPRIVVPVETMERCRDAYASLQGRSAAVFMHLGEGYLTSEMSKSLYLCKSSIESCCYEIRRNMGVASTRQLVAVAARVMHPAPTG